jgi:hypothetical protein
VANDLKYEAVLPLTRTELVARLESNDPHTVASALYSATKYENDWKWVQELCLKGLTSTELDIRWAAATCLGDLAFFRHFPVNFEIVILALERALQDPSIADPAGFSLSIVRQALKKETL